MKYIQAVRVLCEGCGAMADTIRETSNINGQEFHRVHHPKGWVESQVRPALHIVSAEAPTVDPFEPAVAIAGKTGQAINVIRCAKCVAAVAKGVSRIVMPSAPTEPTAPSEPTGGAA